MEKPVKRIDIITPVRSEESEINRFMAELDGLEFPEEARIGVIFVEDSSTDGTVELLRKLSAGRKGVSFFSFRKGYGQGAAVAYGLAASKADAMITMDVDGEHPVELLPGMVRAFLDGADIVQCTREKRTVSKIYRRIGSFVFNRVTSILTGVDLEEQNVYFRLVSSEVRDRLLSGNRWPYFMRLGRSILKKHPPVKVRFDIVINDERVSRYGFWRLAKFSVDGVLSLISPIRFVVLEAAIIAVALMMYMARLKILFILPAALAAYLIYKFISLSSVRLTDLLEVAESGGEAALPDSH